MTAIASILAFIAGALFDRFLIERAEKPADRLERAAVSTWTDTVRQRAARQ
jgi:hypothetical protein